MKEDFGSNDIANPILFHLTTNLLRTLSSRLSHLQGVCRKVKQAPSTPSISRDYLDGFGREARFKIFKEFVALGLVHGL